MNDDPKKPAGERRDGSAGEASPVDSASRRIAGHGPSSGEDAADLPGGHGPSQGDDDADLPGDEGLRALYAQLPDVTPRAELDEAILAASREMLRGVGVGGEALRSADVRGETAEGLGDAESGSAQDEKRRGATGGIAASTRDRSSRRSAGERATRVLRWSLPVAAAASVMFAVLREHGDLGPRAEFAAGPSPHEEPASKPNQEHAGRFSEPSSAPAEFAERDDSASPQFPPSAPPPTAEIQKKAAPPSAETRSAAREAFDSSSAVRDERAMADAPSAANEGRGMPVPPPVASAAPAFPEPSATESADLATAAPPARGKELRSAPGAAMPKSKDSSSAASAIGALAANEASPGFSITEADGPWPFGLEFAMPTEAACAKLRPLSARGCVLHNGVAVVEFDEPRRLSSGVHEGRWIVAVKMIAMDGVITKLDLTERPEREE